MTQPAKIDHIDKAFILLVSTILIGAGVAFFAFIRWQGLLSFPLGGAGGQAGTDDYFSKALEYRERRLALALTYRTFLSSFGFVVGLALASYGGIFIIRKAMAEFSAGFTPPSPPGDGGGGDPLNLQNAKASLVTNSPGIVFMIGGVVVMIATQWLSIPVGSPEIFPGTALVKCDPAAQRAGICYTEDAKTADTQDVRGEQALKIIDAQLGRCEDQPEQGFCKGFSELVEQQLTVK